MRLFYDQRVVDSFSHKVQPMFIIYILIFFLHINNFVFLFRDLSQNELVAVDRSSFTKLAKLRQLLLDHNKISYVEEGAFGYLLSLQTLWVLFIYLFLHIIIFNNDDFVYNLQREFIRCDKMGLFVNFYFIGA